MRLMSHSKMIGRNPPCPKIAKGQPCTPCEGVAVIEQEISETENHLASLKAKHSLFYGQINHSHDPLTSKLPVEIVSKIFINFLPVDVDIINYDVCLRPSSHRGNHEYATTPLVLGAVCAAWRTIAWSTAQLWTSISVNLVGNNETRIGILHEWLRRSGELPLSICIYSDEYFDDTFTGTTVDALASYSHRWFYLAFRFTGGCLGYDIPGPRFGLASALMLNTLEIRDGHPGCLDLGMIPNLKNLYTAALFETTLSNIDWTKLTHVIANVYSVDMWFRHFSNASSMTHCGLRLNQCFTDEVPAAPSVITRHHHLRFLRIGVWNTPMPMSDALPWVEFPALQHLVFSSQDVQINLDAMLDLLQHSQCSLKTLEIDLTPFVYCLRPRVVSLNPFLADIPTLETLEIRRDSVNFYTRKRSNSADPLVTQLAAALSAETAGNRLTFLPNLRELRIVHMKLSWNCILDVLLAHCHRPQIFTAVPSGEESQKPQHTRPLRSFYIKLPVLDGDDEINPVVRDDTSPVFQCVIENGIEVTLAAGLDNEPGYLPSREHLEKSLCPSET